MRSNSAARAFLALATAESHAQPSHSQESQLQLSQSPPSQRTQSQPQSSASPSPARLGFPLGAATVPFAAMKSSCRMRANCVSAPFFPPSSSELLRPQTGPESSQSVPPIPQGRRSWMRLTGRNDARTTNNRGCPIQVDSITADQGGRMESLISLPNPRTRPIHLPRIAIPRGFLP
jgi:hypothetical protein